jgi:SSS family solute:Na+ symporter
MSPTWGGPTFPFAAKVTLNLIGSTIVWVSVTFLTPPVAMEKLVDFYRRVRPPGWWGPVRAVAGDVAPSTGGLRHGVKMWALSVVFVYAALFGSGKLLLLEWEWGLAFAAIAIVTGWVLFRQLARERLAALF